MELERLVDDAIGQLAREQLRLGRRERERPALVLEPRRPVGERPPGLDLGGHVGQLELNRLETSDRPAELPPLLRVRERELVGAARQPEGECRDRDPSAVEDLEELPEALAPGTQQVILRNGAVRKRQDAGVRGVPAELSHRRRDLVAGRAVRDDEIRDLRPARPAAL